MFILDTNILIYYLKGDETVFSYFEENQQPMISLLSRTELLGKKDLTKKELTKLQNFLDTFPAFPIDRDIADRAAFLRREGFRLGDAIIASTAWQLDLPLISHDKVFQKSKKIKVIDPFEK